MLTPILTVLAIIVIIFVVFVATRPPDFRVTRSAAISAPAAAAFSQVNDLRKWVAWSPWEKLDPAMKKTFAGPPIGTGAVCSWAGNKKAGEGRMTITESRQNEMIQMKLEFLKPFKATNTVEITFKPENNQTVVTWNMFGKLNFIAKAFHLFVNCDKMIGSDFENGLAQMKSVVEQAPVK